MASRHRGVSQNWDFQIASRQIQFVTAPLGVLRHTQTIGRYYDKALRPSAVRK